MTANATPLPLRHDTILGVCEALGRDFGFNPLWLRLAFIAPIFFAPYFAVGAYAGLAALVGLTNWLIPDKPASEQIVDATATRVEESAEADEAMPIAA